MNCVHLWIMLWLYYKYVIMCISMWLWSICIHITFYFHSYNTWFIIRLFNWVNLSHMQLYNKLCLQNPECKPIRHKHDSVIVILLIPDVKLKRIHLLNTLFNSISKFNLNFEVWFAYLNVRREFVFLTHKSMRRIT